MSKELLGSLEVGRIYQFDCIQGMKLIPDGADNIGVDLTVTSPPYDKLRKYRGYSFDFENTAKELYRITKHGGVLVWIVSDSTSKGSESGTSFKQSLYFKEIGFNLHDTMIYAKNNYTPLTHNRYEQQFEYMFVFSKGKPKTFNPIMIPCKQQGRIRKSNFTYESGSSEEKMSARRSGKHRNGEVITTNQEKIKPNIWFYDTGKGCSTKDKIAFKHPAIFPDKLAEDHILSWSNEGDIVFDPFMGSGTTAKMAKMNNRKFLGFEISKEYIQIANIRLEAEFNENDDQKILDK